jgi:hypothetical protein
MLGQVALSKPSNNAILESCCRANPRLLNENRHQSLAVEERNLLPKLLNGNATKSIESEMKRTLASEVRSGLHPGSRRPGPLLFFFTIRMPIIF